MCFGNAVGEKSNHQLPAKKYYSASLPSHPLLKESKNPN